MNHLFLDPPSPLTSIADSSPWPSPCRPFKRKLVLGNTPPKKRRPEPVMRRSKFILSPHWHLSEARRDSTSYRGRHILDSKRVVFPKGCPPATRLKLLEDAGYRLVQFENDGRTTFITDRGGTCIGCIIPPSQQLEVIEMIGQKLQELQKVSHNVAKAPRGTFKILRHGIQMGSGSKIPSPCWQTKCERAEASSFFNDQNVKNHLKKIATVFRYYFPKLHQYYWSTLGMASSLIYDGSAPSMQIPFACFTLNVGNQCICDAHIDGHNLPCGLCLASPFGNFNYKKGGHLILHELRLVLEVPPGASVLFASAIITHENIPVGKGEFRQSITAFTPGSLFKWVDAGFRRVNQVGLMNNGVIKRYYSKNARTKTATAQDGAKVWVAMARRFPHFTSLF